MSDATKQDFYTIFVNRQTYFGMPVSIHAPAWGATTCANLLLLSNGDFNPRTRVGCDDFAYIYDFNLSISIHAPAWGATLFGCNCGFSNPISIHAPAWGATFPDLPLKALRVNFNPRTRVGCDLILSSSQ